MFFGPLCNQGFQEYAASSEMLNTIKDLVDLANVQSAAPLPNKKWAPFGAHFLFRCRHYRYNHESAADKTSHSNSCNGRPARKKSENW